MEGNTLVQEKLLGLPNRPSSPGIPAGTPPVPQPHPGACAASALLPGWHVRISLADVITVLVRRGTFNSMKKKNSGRHVGRKKPASPVRVWLVHVPPHKATWGSYLTRTVISGRRVYRADVLPDVSPAERAESPEQLAGLSKTHLCVRVPSDECVRGLGGSRSSAECECAGVRGCEGVRLARAAVAAGGDRHTAPQLPGFPPGAGALCFPPRQPHSDRCAGGGCACSAAAGCSGARASTSRA